MTSPQHPYGGPPLDPPPASPWAQGPGIGAQYPPQHPPHYSPESGTGALPYPQGPATGPYQYPQGPATGAYQYPQPFAHVPQPGGYGPPPPAPRKGPKWPWVVGGIVLLVIIIGSAGAGRGDRGTTSTARPTATVAAPAPAALAPADQSDAGSGPGIVSWGQRATTADGLGIEVAKPEAYKPSRSAAGNDRERAVKVTTTVVNGTSKPYELNTFVIGPTATHDGRPAPVVIDIGGGADIVGVTTVLPGKSFSYSAVYSVGAQEADLQLEYRADFMEDPVIVVGRA
jgi:hypothetical protein